MDRLDRLGLVRATASFSLATKPTRRRQAGVATRWNFAQAVARETIYGTGAGNDHMHAARVAVVFPLSPHGSERDRLF